MIVSIISKITTGTEGGHGKDSGNLLLSGSFIRGEREKENPESVFSRERNKRVEVEARQVCGKAQMLG